MWIYGHCSSKRQTTNCVRANFFSKRVINYWNSLPHTVYFSSSSKFKRTVKHVDFTDFQIFPDSNVHFIKLVCLLCSVCCIITVSITMGQSRQWVNGSWVSGSNGSQFWMGHMGHGSQYADPLTFTAYVFILWISTNSLKGRIYR